MDDVMVQGISGHGNMMASHEEHALKRHTTNTGSPTDIKPGTVVNSRCIS